MAILAAAAAAFVLAGCGPDGKVEDGPVLRVAATVPPVAAFARAVGGERVEVSVMVPPGANPHSFEPRPSTLEKLSRAGVYLKVGSGLEFENIWMPRFIDMNPEMTVVDCSEGVELIGDDGGDDGEDAHEEGEDDGHDRDHEQEEVHGTHDDYGHDHRVDPHVWLSPRNAVVMVENIARAFAGADPEGADVYHANAKAYTERLGALDREIREILRGRAGRKVLVYHPAWTYFTAEYGLKQVAMEREGKDPTPGAIAELVSLARSEKLATIVASPEFTARGAEAVAAETGAEVVRLSPLAEDYIENLRRLARAFARKGGEDGNGDEGKSVE